MNRKAAPTKKPALLRKPESKVVKTLTTGETIFRPSDEPAFREVFALIERARERAFQAVNTELIDLYWQVGELISRRIASDGWGQSRMALS